MKQDSLRYGKVVCHGKMFTMKMFTMIQTKAVLKAVFFDLFNTLVYVHGPKPYHRLFTKLGLSSEEKHHAKRIAMTQDFPTLDDFVAVIKPDAAFSPEAFNLEEYKRDIAEEIAQTKLYPEVKDTLATLKKQGLVIGVISNLASPYKETFFLLGLDKLTDHVIFSCDVGYTKPQKEIYQLMLRKAGISAKQVIMTGDKLPQDVFGPKSIGMHAVLLDRKNKSTYAPRITCLDDIVKYI